MIPALLAGAGAVMAGSTIVNLVRDLANPDLSDEDKAIIEKNLRAAMKGQADQMRARGAGEEQIQAELQAMAQKGMEQMDDGPKVGVGDLALAAAGLIPGVGAARMGLKGLRGAYGAGRGLAAATGSKGIGQVIGGLDEAAMQAMRSGAFRPQIPLASGAAQRSARTLAGRVANSQQPAPGISIEEALARVAAGAR